MADRGVLSVAFCAADGLFDLAVPDFVFDRWPQVGIEDYETVSVALAQAGAPQPRTPWPFLHGQAPASIIPAVGAARSVVGPAI